MSKSFQTITQDINQTLGKFAKEMPDVMQAFHSLSKAASKDGALDKKTKELIAIAISVAGHCEGCIGFHSQALVKLGVTREELLETLGMAVYLGGGPSLMYAAEAMQAYEEFSQ